MTEILAPAGDEATAKRAYLAGADAVYLGLKSFSARSSAENFDFDALKRTADFAHLLGKKLYVCLNTLVKDSETEEFFRHALKSAECGADAIIMQDLFLGKILKKGCPELTLHLSTQAGCCNEYGAKLAKECGFSRVVLARETALEDIEKISKIIETEVFVQGALCSGFSGQCYFSSFAGNNSGNRGRCKQPCRKQYSIDRAGFEEYAYALSPADLCVGEKIAELQRAGVTSFKIEGRMRRSEYVASAVGYYRTLLEGGEKEAAFSDLKRAYNRGDYTQGLAFGEKHFLSRNVQGHIGEKVGILGNRMFLQSDYPAKVGDGFKILRKGREVGGASFLRSGTGGFYLSSSEKLLPGDEVRLTTDVSLSSRLPERKRKLILSLFFRAGEPARVTCEGFEFIGPIPQRAQNAPLSREILKECFSKTGEDPFEAAFSEIVCEDAFLPMSSLNEMRRNFYAGLKNSLLKSPFALSFVPPEVKIEAGEERKTAVICSDGVENADILIYKPKDYHEMKIPKGNFLCFLYLPPYFTGKDLAAIEEKLSLFDGIYSDGCYALLLAREHSMPFFAGTGWNLTNKYAVFEAQSRCDFYAISKELSEREQRALLGRGAFVLSSGAIKVMDLCYCPFERSCATCDRRDTYTLTDEAGRKFSLRRYRGENCRFEVYNCSPLSENPLPAGKIFDKSVLQSAPPTKGHLTRSML